ncbi:GTP-binding protein [Synechocystis salina]|uniref:GTP-binding protein n=1 Tax=Synechocystis salina LEGE 00031 TaxID=1828736 RepID=A0ABR9VQU0_9SYNC|nr:GTP-binding protein [Synechocystis salina]MBE9242266.1 GTP-binding protein [Synechocystis salina LEGE 00041]MBE9253278.1 GTP-binding protein [Synechocystis salina LEGE 00031]
MRSPSLIAVAGPPGTGKTTWITEQLQNIACPTFYFSPGLGPISVDLARINYTFPAVQIITGDRGNSWLTNVPPEAVVYCELGFHLDLNSAQFGPLPYRRVGVLPPSLKDSEWHGWADEIITGNDLSPTNPESLPNLWRSPLTGIVFDPPSLEMILTELTGGAYGELQRLKGIFEMPDGRAFYIDFVQGLTGIEYTELPLEPWLEGRPQRFSGIELAGWNLNQKLIADTLLEGCLADEILTHYQQQYKNFNPLEEAISG